MTKRAGRFLRRRLMAFGATTVLLAGMLARLSAFSFADDGPKPDPAGTATGDKSAAVDAAGNPFVPRQQIKRLLTMLRRKRRSTNTRLKRRKNPWP